MRVLFVTNRFPGILTRGDQLRSFQQILHLSKRHAITLLAFDEPGGDPHDLARLQACCERVIVAPRNPVGMAWRAMRACFTKQAFQVAIYDAVPASAALRSLLAESGFDIAHVQLARLGPMLQRLAPLACVLDMVDALSLNMARRGMLDRSPLGFVARIEAARLAVYENELAQQAAGVAISSAVDRKTIGAGKAQLVNNGVDLHRFPFVADAGTRGEGLVFTGNLGYFPNVDAASWFALEVMPRLLQHVPGARLQLVGARPAARLHRIASHSPGVELVGPVESMHPFLSRAAVAVVPLRSGSGQQLKMLEAMASGTPVVATSQSTAGLRAKDGEHLLVADGAEEMTAAIVRLLGDPALRTRLAARARELVEREHSWEQSACELEKLWLAVAATAGTDDAALRANALAGGPLAY
jgi:glycosyltransferase involved in cell wall biosynthesis